jgi:hypothetical protein
LIVVGLGRRLGGAFPKGVLADSRQPSHEKRERERARKRERESNRERERERERSFIDNHKVIGGR